MREQQQVEVSKNAEFVGVAQDESGRPLYIIRDEGEKSRARGLVAHKANISVARALAETLQTSLGPRGADKILESQDYELTITNDGATILEKMDVENHVARLLVDLSKCQDEEIGDGTTGVVVLAGALLDKAEALLDKGIHPIRIAEGYEMACQIAIQRLTEVAESFGTEKIDFQDKRFYELLVKSAETSLNSKIVNNKNERMARIAVDVVISACDDRGDVNFEFIKIKQKIGGTLDETESFTGVLLEEDVSHQNMQKSFKNCKIAVLTCPFEPPKPKSTYSIEIDSVEKFKALYAQEEEYFVDMVRRVKASGCDLVVCQWGFDDEANSLLEQNGISAVRWAKGEDIESVAIATGAKIIARFEDLAPEKLGIAESVEVLSLGTSGEKFLKIVGENKRIETVFIRGGNMLILDEAERSLHDAICVVRNLIKDEYIVYGGGAAEICAGLAVLDASETGTEQYAMRQFADALDEIPLNLAKNSGVDEILAVSEARRLEATTNEAIYGVDCSVGSKGAGNMKEEQVFETLSSKVEQLMLATQVVRMILKIDEVIDDNEEGE